MSYLDLTHPFTPNMPVFPGDQTPTFDTVATVKTDGYHAVRLSTGMHVGTHMDAPAHMISQGRTLNEYPLDHFTGLATVIDVQGIPRIGPEVLKEVDTEAVRILLFHAGFDRKFGTPSYYRDYPELTPELATELTNTGIRIVGLDWPSPDRAPYAVHRILLGNDILIIENLKGLETLINKGHVECYAFPYTYDIEGSPVRVVVKLP